MEVEEEAHLEEVDLVVEEASDAIKTTTNNTLKTVIQQILLVGRLFDQFNHLVFARKSGETHFVSF